MIDQIRAKAKAYHPALVEIRSHLHAHPELSYQEYETADFVEAQLRAAGIETKRMADTGVIGMVEGAEGGKTIALRADLDALPILEQNKAAYKSINEGVMHACGHDVHSTSLLGTAFILNDLKAHWKGCVKFIFQPGEEQLPGGASLLIKAGVLENPAPASIMAQHVYPELDAGKVGFRPGKYMASCDELYFTVKGKGGHGALPHGTIDPVLVAAHIIIALQQVVSRNADPLMASVLSIGKVEANGATNVIPGEVKMAGTFRTFDEEWRNKAHQRITEIAEGIAKAHGALCEVRIEKGYPFVMNDVDLTMRCKALAQAYLGEANVVDLEMRATGEDFSYYSQLIPGCFYRLGVRNEAAGIVHPVHSPLFDADMKSLETGSGLMAWLAINELNTL